MTTTVPSASRYGRRALAKTGFVIAVFMVLSGASFALTATAHAQDGPPPASVVVDAVVESALTGTTPILGRVVSQGGGVVAAQVTGPIDSILVKVGDRVEQGAVLATLDRQRLELAAALAEAEWQTAQADVAAARARHDQARLVLNRLNRLKGSSAFSQARFEDAQTDVVRTRSEIASAEAEEARMLASFELARLDLERSTVRAPYTGIVTARQAQPGLYATPGTPIVTMVDTSDLEVEADVPFNRLGGLAPGNRVTVSFDDATDKEATVRAIIPEENPRTRTRLVRFALNDTMAADSGLAINASVTVNIPNTADGRAPTVHKDGIVKSPAGAFAFVAVPQESGPPMAERRDVIIGEAVGNRFIVREGLNLGDLVVIRGNERLRPGQTLQFPSEG